MSALRILSSNLTEKRLKTKPGTYLSKVLSHDFTLLQTSLLDTHKFNYFTAPNYNSMLPNLEFICVYLEVKQTLPHFGEQFDNTWVNQPVGNWLSYAENPNS